LKQSASLEYLLRRNCFSTTTVDESGFSGTFTPQPPAPSDQATHAAAHIIAALVLRVPVSEVDLSSENHLFLDEQWENSVKETRDLQGYEAYCAILYAPYFVEVKCSLNTRASLDDRVAFEEIVEQHFPDSRRLLMARSKNIIEDHYDEIVRLAKLLTERGKLAAKEIVEFWNQRGKK
jgi:hypothetical protein